MITEPCDNGSWPVPPQIRPEHKQRFALIYVRQSSFTQVRNHTGSTETQRDLAELPRRWGWPVSLILTIEDDLGLSGASSHLRTGFQRLLEMIDRGEVGIVLVRELSRLSRDPLDAEQFLKKAIRRGVLVEVNGRIYDPANGDLPELFGLRIQALLAWWENQHRVVTFKAAKEARVRQGYAVSRPPIGYVEAIRGKWTKDDQAVQVAIRRLFDLYLERRSITKVAKYLREHHLMFPKRVRGALRWEFIGALAVLRVLTNPNYMGDYAFRRRRLLPRDEADRQRLERVPRTEWIIARDHHDPYVSREEWDAVQIALRGRGRGPNRRPPEGKGQGYLQSRIACGLCDRWMTTLHDGRRPAPGRPRIPRYACIRKDKDGVLLHRVTCSALLLDPAIVREVLAVLSPPSIEAAITAINEEGDRREAMERGWRSELRRAEDEAADLASRYRHVDLKNAEVKVYLEQEAARALRHLDELRRELPNRTSDRGAALSKIDAAELVALGAQIEPLWNAPTMTNEDRKRLIELVISRVVVRSSTDEAIDIEIAWASGVREPRRVLRPKGVDLLISDLRRAGQPVSEILDTLGAMGVTTYWGRSFTRKILQHKLWLLGFDTKTDRIKALRLIHSMLLERRSRREMLEALRSQGPQPKEGEWTPSGLQSAILSLRKNLWPDEVPPLPPDVPTLRRLPPEAIAIIRQGRAAGRIFKAIAEELNARGFRTPRGRAFTMLGLYQLYQHLKADGALDDVALPPAGAPDERQACRSGKEVPTGAMSPDSAPSSEPRHLRAAL